MFTSTQLSLIHLGVAPFLFSGINCASVCAYRWWRTKQGVSIWCHQGAGSPCLCVYTQNGVKCCCKMKPAWAKHGLKDLGFCSLEELGSGSSLIPLIRTLRLNLSPHVTCGSGFLKKKGLQNGSHTSLLSIPLVLTRKASYDVMGVG